MTTEPPMTPGTDPASRTLTALYPGTFDPVTLGHLDIVQRSSKMFPRVVVAVSAASVSKRYAFDTEERIEMLRRVVTPFPNIEVVPFTGLLTQFARQIGASVLIRGLRAITDFDYEFQMAAMNHTLAPEVETVFLMTSTRYSYLSSSIVKEIAVNHGRVDHLLPKEILQDVIDRFSRPRE